MASAKCRRCNQTVYPTEATTYDETKYHTTCFKCLICNGQLTPSSIAQLNGKLYCKNCFERMFKETGGSYDKFRRRDEADVPYFTSGPQFEENKETECWGCKQSLGEARTVMAQEHKWHAKCWKCHDCENPFFDGQNLGKCFHKGEKIICSSCADDSSPCGACGESISWKLQGGFITALGKRWHHKCWGCAVCRKPATKVQLHLSRSGFPHCQACTPPPGQDIIPWWAKKDGRGTDDDSKDRYCWRCRKQIDGLIRRVFGHSYHVECFTCMDCKTPFTANSEYFPYGENAFCGSCFEKKAPLCPECNQPVTSKGVRAFDKTWHAKCFVCNNCKKVLEDGRYKELSDRPGVPFCGTCDF